MAMKIGGEYGINNIQLINFDKLADEIGFSKPEVQRRILELVDTIISALSQLEINHPVQTGVSVLIKERCERMSRSKH